MTVVIKNKPEMIEWSVASRPLTGQTVSGDLHVVKFFDGGVLLAVIDGVGHGNEADEAAHVASGIMEKHAGESPISLMQLCHKALAQTRGAVITLSCLNFDENTLNWLGVGNVEARLFRADPKVSPAQEHILLRGGLVGCQLPSLHASILPIMHRDLLVFATDGLHAEFDRQINLAETPAQIAENILNRNFKGTDDALALAVRYLGHSK